MQIFTYKLFAFVDILIDNWNFGIRVKSISGINYMKNIRNYAIIPNIIDKTILYLRRRCYRKKWYLIIGV